MKRVIRPSLFLVAAMLLGGVFSSSQIVNAQSLVISEFRFRGPTSANDEFIEFYNNSDVSITVTDSSPDGNPATPDGWALIANNASTVTNIRFLIPEGTVIPARGHFLAVNTGAYSLGTYAAGNQVYNNINSGNGGVNIDTTLDAGYTNGITDVSGIALFSTANTAQLPPTNTANPNPFLLDAVGSSDVTDTRFREGTGFTSPGTTNATGGEQSYVRKAGGQQDNNNNATDFIFITTTGGTLNSRASTLGAPGPENLTSPVLRGNDSNLSRVNTSVNASTSPNRERDTNSYTDTLTPSAPNGGTPATNPYTLGTLSLRRRFTNTSSVTLTSLRMRVNSLTTLTGGASPPTGTADVRVLTSPTLNGITVTSPGTGTVVGITLDQPPTQARGGGVNSSLSIPLPGNSLAPGASVDINILLGVVQGGTYQISVSFEGLP